MNGHEDMFGDNAWQIKDGKAGNRGDKSSEGRRSLDTGSFPSQRAFARHPQ
jgi:hypothetical protein